MKKLLIFFYVFFFLGCSFHNVSVESSYIPNGISIEYNASKNLNFFNGQSHSTMLVVYFLNDKNMFDEICNHDASFLLKGKKFNKSVLGVNYRIIYPNSSGKISLDKLKDTKYVGLVVGFYENPACLIVPLNKKKIYFNSLKFWKPKIIIEGLSVYVKLYDNYVEIVKRKNNE